MADYIHMPGCENPNDECVIERTITDRQCVVQLLGARCDGARIEIEGGVVNVDELDQLIETLTQLRPSLAEWRREADCEGHDHSEDDEATVCKGCGESGVNVYFLAEVGYRCEACWAAAGIPIPSGWRQ